MRATFVSKFPEITFSDSDWEIATDLYPCFFGEEWDVTPCDDNIILYLLAHLIIVIQHQQSSLDVGGVGSGGRVQSESVGNVSVSYAVTPFGVDQELKYGIFNQTSYGKVYLSLIKNKNHYGGVFV